MYRVIAFIEIECRYCKSFEVSKHGRQTGKQRYRCRDCQRSFQLDYQYNERKKGVKKQIIVMAQNGSGVRDTSRVLQVSMNTVTDCLKKLAPLQVNPFIKQTQQVSLCVEGDEQWAYVHSKKNQRWLWYFLDRTTKKIVAYVFGPRTDETFKRLLKLVERLSMTHIFTDDWKAYERCLTNVGHTVSKKFTQNIERINLNFRTHIKRLTRKSICFSKSEVIHDNLIGAYIQNNHFNSFEI